MRCTRACGFCLVDTRHPEAPDPGEPERVAEAVEQMGLRYAVQAVADAAATPDPDEDKGHELHMQANDHANQQVMQQQAAALAPEPSGE